MAASHLERSKLRRGHATLLVLLICVAVLQLQRRRRTGRLHLQLHLLCEVVHGTATAAEEQRPPGRRRRLFHFSWRSAGATTHLLDALRCAGGKPVASPARSHKFATENRGRIYSVVSIAGRRSDGAARVPRKSSARKKDEASLRLLTQKFCPAPQVWSPTVNRGEPGFKGRIGCAGFVHPSHRAHRWARVCF